MKINVLGQRSLAKRPWPQHGRSHAAAHPADARLSEVAEAGDGGHTSLFFGSFWAPMTDLDVLAFVVWGGGLFNVGFLAGWFACWRRLRQSNGEAKGFALRGGTIFIEPDPDLNLFARPEKFQQDSPRVRSELAKSGPD